jgi:hypothetical protein
MICPVCNRGCTLSTLCDCKNRCLNCCEEFHCLEEDADDETEEDDLSDTLEEEPWREDDDQCHN